MLTIRNLARPLVRLDSFDLPAGECAVVRGSSGSGKTLLLRALADLDPNEGEIRLDDRERHAMPAPEWRRLVTYVAAEPAWWADRAGDHFADWASAEPMTQALGLGELPGDAPIARLSTGERQRLGLIRALVQHPRVLLLDEPTAALDPDATARVERLLAERFAEGTSALWVSHDAPQAKRVARRCLVIEHGRAREAPL